MSLNFSDQRPQSLTRVGLGSDLKRTEKIQLNLHGSGYNLLMRHLILLAITKRCNIWVKWRGWYKEYIRQVMIWQLWTSVLLVYFILENKCSPWYVVSKILSTCWVLVIRLGKSSKLEACDSYRNLGCSLQETWTSNLPITEDQWVPSAVLMVLLQSQHQKRKRKFCKFSIGLHR